MIFSFVEFSKGGYSVIGRMRTLDGFMAPSLDGKGV